MVENFWAIVVLLCLSGLQLTAGFLIGIWWKRQSRSLACGDLDSPAAQVLQRVRKLATGAGRNIELHSARLTERNKSLEHLAAEIAPFAQFMQNLLGEILHDNRQLTEKLAEAVARLDVEAASISARSDSPRRRAVSETGPSPTAIIQLEPSGYNDGGATLDEALADGPPFELRVAPYVSGRLPPRRLFSRVEGFGLSPVGFSFLQSEPFLHDSLVAEIGMPDDERRYLSARVKRCSRFAGETSSKFLVECEIQGRLAAPAD